jgi:hypothetical protein
LTVFEGFSLMGFSDVKRLLDKEKITKDLFSFFHELFVEVIVLFKIRFVENSVKGRIFMKMHLL